MNTLRDVKCRHRGRTCQTYKCTFLPRTATFSAVRSDHNTSSTNFIVRLTVDKSTDFKPNFSRNQKCRFLGVQFKSTKGGGENRTSSLRCCEDAPRWCNVTKAGATLRVSPGEETAAVEGGGRGASPLKDRKRHSVHKKY